MVSQQRNHEETLTTAIIHRPECKPIVNEKDLEENKELNGDVIEN